jgi:hypothetical protein
MELDDVFYLGKRPTTLRLVLGLMEDAETSLETYRWAVPALMRSFDTNDRQLYKYVEDVFNRKGLTPYVSEKKKEGGSTEATNKKMVMNPLVLRSKVKMAIEELMSLKDAKGDRLFCQKNHWWAVFRLFVDHQVGNIRENRYKEFMDLISATQLDHVNAELDMATLSNITQDIYRFPFKKWEFFIPEDASTRWMTAYNRMYKIADLLDRILIEKGF